MVNTKENWLDAQVSVLGSVLIDPTVLPVVMDGTSEEDFTGQFRTVYRAIRSLYANDLPVDPVTVKNKLGDAYTDTLLKLMEMTPTAANVAYHVELCKARSRLLRLRDVGLRMQEIDDLEAAQSLADEMNRLLVMQDSSRVTGMEDALSDFFRRHDDNRKPDYLQWPIEELNAHLYTEPGDFVILGGRPSAGKSALAIQLAFHFAATKRVGFFSLETSDKKLFDRQMAAVSGVSMEAIKNNCLTDQDWQRVAASHQALLSRPLEYIEASRMTVRDMLAMSRARRYEVIFVDYLQIVPSAGKDRFSKVTEISIDLHRLARSANITVIALCQLNRGEKGREPSMEDLRESGQIEQDADVVLMLTKTTPDLWDHRRDLRILKNKEGFLGKLVLDFDGKHQRFSRSAG